MKTWDEIKRERMPDLDTHPEKHPEYFHVLTKLDFARQLHSARNAIWMDRAELALKLQDEYPDITEDVIGRFEEGFELPDPQLIQSIAWILKTVFTLHFYPEKPL